MSEGSVTSSEPNAHGHFEVGHHRGSENYSDANRVHFNKVAHKVDDKPAIQELVARVTNIIKDNYIFDPESTNLLDYACGTGLLAVQLAPLTKETIGVDISQAMVDFFNAKAEKQGLAPDRMRGICQELKVGGKELDGKRFDLIICTMAYHHFPDINSVTSILASYLKPGGSLFVTDGYKVPGDDHSDILEANPQYKEIIAHKGGIEEEAIHSAFQQAGLGKLSCNSIGDFTFLGKTMELFLMKGTKHGE